MDAERLAAIDRAHLWHPYTAFGDDAPVFAVESARGCRLRLREGRELIDGMASWWCAIHGYNHPRLKQAMTRQIEQVSHVMFGGLTHEPAARLAELLLEITPPPLQAIFYADSGSVAVEVALKMALQYQRGRGDTRRCRFATVRGGYYGDTGAAMSLSDPVNGMHAMFAGMMPRQLHAPRPACRFDGEWDAADFIDMERLVARHARELAGVIIEPIAQGAGGMWFYHPQYLKELRRLCDRYDLPLIFDEIATGFGRTGKLFAMQHAEVTPDILCLGKALTGGMINMAAVMTTETIAETINESPAGVFMHGPTFMANPLACAAAAASVELLLTSDWQRRVREIETRMRDMLVPARESPAVRDVRVLGAIGVIEMSAPVEQAALCRAFVERGVWLRPFGRYVYTMPPFVISEDDLAALCSAMVEQTAGTSVAGRVVVAG